MIRIALPFALLLAFPAHAQTDSPTDLAASPECSRLRAEIAGAESAKRAAACPAQEATWASGD